MSLEEKFGTKPVLNRDLQILIGEKITAGTGTSGSRRYVTDGTFNLFMASRNIRGGAVTSLRKLQVFTLNESQARIASADGKKSICIDLGELTGYVYLKHLVEMMVQHNSGKFFVEVYLISLKEVDIGKLFDILLQLKDLTVLNLPFEFDTFSRNSDRKKLDALIKKNANTLQSLHHLIYPFALLAEIREKVITINCSTLRTGSLEKEEDFFAFYLNKIRCPTELMPPTDDDGSVLMRICIHRYKELFRSIKKAFQRDILRSKITTLHLCSVYDFDIKSAQTVLSQIVRIQSTLPRLNSLKLELRTLECYPDNHHAGLANGFHDEWDEDDLIPTSASVCSNVATSALKWLREQKLDFYLDVNIKLVVDYQCDKEFDTPQLEKVMRETISLVVGPQWAKEMDNSVIVQNGFVTASAKVNVNDQINLSFVIEFRTITVCIDLDHHQRNLFRVTHTL